MTLYPCSDCGFELEQPIRRLRISHLGLVNDDRYPGRCVLELNPHFDSLADVPLSILNEFMADIKDAMGSIYAATACDHVNMAVMGDRHSHIHAHLIPRFPRREDHPDESPWDDERVPGQMNDAGVQTVIEAIRRHL